MAKHLETKTGERTFVFEFTEQETALLAVVLGYVASGRLDADGPTRQADAALDHLLVDLTDEHELDTYFLASGTEGNISLGDEIPVSVLK